MSVIGDNLGLNTSLGFIRSFVGNHYCRICELPRSQCQRQIDDLPGEHRTKLKYQAAMNVISATEKVDTQMTKGIVQYCVLNDLKYFHTVDNFSVDIMHDLLEGNVPFLLRKFFELGIRKKVFTEQELINKCIYFDYGILDQCFLPTDLRLKSNSLGQNASQSRCLITNLPFILYELKDNTHLKEAWVALQSLLDILTIVHASELHASDIEKLKSSVKNHLSSIINLFGSDLLPKHHFSLHYARCIEEMGPIVHMSTLSYEMKHKSLTAVVKKSNNFMNVSKSIAENHQRMTVVSSPYGDKVEHAALKISDRTILDRLGILSTEVPHTILWLRLNNTYYRKGLMILFEGNFYCIDYIFAMGQSYLFVCTEYVYVRFDEFLNSFEISEKEPQIQIALYESRLNNKKSYCRKIIGSQFYVYANTVDMFYLLNTK